MVTLYIVLGGVFVLVTLYYMLMSHSSQIFGAVQYRLDTGKKEVVLSFDDGPNEPHTSDLLAVLARHKVHANFFVCGACIDRHPGLVQKIRGAGHVVGNHSHQHKFRDYLNMPKYRQMVVATNKKIEHETGALPTLYRSPWLFRTPGLLRYIKSIGMQTIWGTFGCELEIYQPSAEFMARRALRLVRPGTIFIFHDGRESRGGFRGNTVAAIDKLIPTLRERGYSFTTVK
jgi:peptidoglycan-N-acetylglucosamine deacetylase